MIAPDDDEALEIPKITTQRAELVYWRFPPGEPPELVTVVKGQAFAATVRRETMWRVVLEGIRALELEEVRERQAALLRARAHETD